MNFLRRLATYRGLALATVVLLTLPHACGF
jgi:hypothetical protein